MNTAIENTIREMAKEIYNMACGFEMSQVMATYHLTNLLGMCNEKQREAIIAMLPTAVDIAMKKTLDYVEYNKHSANIRKSVSELVA